MIVVVGVDDSRRSAVAARKAARLAVWLDADLHAVHVSHIPAALLAVLAGVESGTTEFTEAQRRAVWESVDPVLEQSGARIVRAELEGHPADVLVRYAREVDAALLVVGSRRRGELASLVLGSTSHRVVNTAACDVLVAKGD